MTEPTTMPTPAPPVQIVNTPTTGFGSMGLPGWFGVVGNSTAMVLVGVLLLITVFQIRGMHTESMTVLERLHVQQREIDKVQNEMLGRTVDKNTTAVDNLAVEMRLLREYRQRENKKEMP